MGQGAGQSGVAPGGLAEGVRQSGRRAQHHAPGCDSAIYAGRRENCCGAAIASPNGWAGGARRSSDSCVGRYPMCAPPPVEAARTRASVHRSLSSLPRRARGRGPTKYAPSDGRARRRTIHLPHGSTGTLLCQKGQPVGGPRCGDIRGRRPAVLSPAWPAITPSSRASALRGVEWSGGPLLSHLGLRLMPAEPVLIVGVSRRCRSVACVRADASPNEVYAPHASARVPGAAHDQYTARGPCGQPLKRGGRRIVA